MKKFLSVLLLILTVVCLCGCSHGADLDKINKMLKEPHQTVTINVQSQKGETELTSKFVILWEDDQTTVTYRIEQLATFSEDTPDNYKNVAVGSVAVKDGNVVSQTGTPVQNIDFENVTTLGLNFSKKFLKNVKVSDGSLNAKVTNPKAFLGDVNLQCKQDSMAVSVKYSQTIQSITVRYTTPSDATMLLTYIFS